MQLLEESRLAEGEKRLVEEEEEKSRVRAAATQDQQLAEVTARRLRFEAEAKERQIMEE